MNMAWERGTELGNCADYWITDVEYDACVIFYNETGGGEAPRVSLTVLESEMGEWRFVETFWWENIAVSRVQIFRDLCLCV